MTDRTVGVDVSGGQIQGIVGAGSVVIENLTFYNRPPEEPAQPAGAEPIGPCPYPGLAYFGPADADLFFGRDAAITRLAEAVGRQSFTALVGASGSGKSSVVLAGLAPRLQSDSAGNWRFSHFRIGTELEANPFLALARALAPLYVASDSDVERLRNTKLLAASLAAGELTLRDVFADCRSRNKGRRILLIADQFEEAFTLVGDEAVRSRFIDVLLAGFPEQAAGAVPDICLILTMRADFYGRALLHRPLADALQNHVENLGPMKREELQAAIVRPAGAGGVTFESGLVETLLDAVESKPGGLPLLQFALREMWARQERKTITRKSYDEIGGVEGALAQRAETVFAGLTRNGADPEMEKTFQRLFTRLVTLGEGQQDTRRVVERAELGDEGWGLAQRLAGEENRLVVTNASSTHETAEVVHEALIRHWPRMVDWINRDRAFQSWLRQIKSNIELWSTNPTDEGPLLRGGMLAQAKEWFAKRRDDLSQNERGYIEASIAATEMRERQARRAVTLTRIAAAVFLILFVAMSFLAVGLVGASSEAEERSQEAVAAARESAQQTARAQGAIAKIENDNARYFEAARAALAGLSVPLAVDKDPSQIAPWIELLRAVTDGFLIPPLHHQAKVSSAVFDPTGERVVTISDDNAVRIWNARTGGLIGKPLQHESRVNSAVFDFKGERVVIASADNTARIWDTRTGEPIGKPLQHDWAVAAAAFDLRGERIVTASWDQTARIWDARTGEPIGKPLQHEAALNAAVFDAQGERVITAAGKTALIWNARTGEPIGQPMQHEWQVFTAVVDAAGERVVTTSQHRPARIWDARTGEPVGAPLEQQAEVTTAVFDSKGERVVTSAGNIAQVWDARTGASIGKPLQHQDTISAAVFDPGGERIVTASEDRTARIWDARTGVPIGNPLQHQSGVTSAIFDPKGERVITSAGNIVRTWDVRPAEPLPHDDIVHTALFDPKGERVITCAGNTARIWDLRTGQPIGKPLEHQNGVNTAVFDPKGERVVTSAGNIAQVWDARTGAPIGKQLQHRRGRGVAGAVFDPKGERVVTASDDRTAQVWDARTGEPIGKPLQHDGAVKTAVFDPAGERVVTGSYDLAAHIWDARTGEPIGGPLQHRGLVETAVFDPTGERILTASTDGTARIWNSHTGELIGKPLRHDKSVNSAMFDPGGQRVVTASHDHTARIWDARTSEPIGEPLQHDNRVNTAAFDHAGERVLTASDDNTARIWDARTGAPIGRALQHQNSVGGAAFDPKGERVVTVAEDRTARIWSSTLPTGRALLDQVRTTLGGNAPAPLKLPSTAERRGFVDAMAKGLGIIWSRIAVRSP
jgi:WD40 repeat protein